MLAYLAPSIQSLCVISAGNAVIQEPGRVYLDKQELANYSILYIPIHWIPAIPAGMTS